MQKRRIFMVTSCKGGVGKSTICANLALALAKRGKQVLLLDCDFGMKCLDLLLGCENQAIFGLSDGVRQTVRLEKLFLQPLPALPNLRFCAAPEEQEGEAIDEAAFLAFLERAAQAFSPDFILLDTPGDLSHPFRLAAAAAGKAILLTTSQPSALRGAEKTAFSLQEKEIEPFLVLNFVKKRPRRRQEPEEEGGSAEQGLWEMLRRTGAPLLGAVPFSSPLADRQAEGLLADRAGKEAFLPFENMAARLCGENRPLFCGLRERDRETLKQAIL